MNELNSILTATNSIPSAGLPVYYNTGGYVESSTDTDYFLEMPIVGVPKENVKVEFEDNLLTINVTADPKSKYTRSFKDSFVLNKSFYDFEAATAKLENGLLTVRIPKVKPAKKTFSVSVN